MKKVNLQAQIDYLEDLTVRIYASMFKLYKHLDEKLGLIYSESCNDTTELTDDLEEAGRLIDDMTNIPYNLCGILKQRKSKRTI